MSTRAHRWGAHAPARSRTPRWRTKENAWQTDRRAGGGRQRTSSRAFLLHRWWGSRGRTSPRARLLYRWWGSWVGGGVISGRLCTSPRVSLLYRWWGSSEEVISGRSSRTPLTRNLPLKLKTFLRDQSPGGCCDVRERRSAVLRARVQRLAGRCAAGNHTPGAVANYCICLSGSKTLVGSGSSVGVLDGTANRCRDCYYS